MDDTARILLTFGSEVGDPLTAYLLNIESADDVTSYILGLQKLGVRQQAVVTLLGRVLDSSVAGQTSQSSRGEVLRAILMQQADDGMTFARSLHLQSGGSDGSPLGTDELEQPIEQIALDVFPALLLPRRGEFPDRTGLSIEATAVISRHPALIRFQEAVLGDKKLGRLFPTTNEAAEPAAWIWRNTGAGGTEQLTMLPTHILQAAWRHTKHDRLNQGLFVLESLTQLRLMSKLLSGKSVLITATFAFTGVLLPDDEQRIELPNGTLECATSHDRELAPEVLKQQVRGTDASGTTTVASHDGDIVLRLPMPLKLQISEAPAPETVPLWPEDMHPPDFLERSVERLRLSLILAAEPHSRAYLLPTWRYFDDPFGHGQATVWSDPRRAVGLMPNRLTADEVASWVSWYKALAQERIDRINVAVTRILNAMAERNEPTDILIDSVIAWENIFGTREGEPTLRVTASLAILLEDDPGRRRVLWSRLARIYRLRSDVVHGNRSLKFAEFPLCQEALDVAVRALRILARERSDILHLPDGAARSQHVILGE